MFSSTQLGLPASAQISYPFCFDNHAKPSSRNPFLLIIIQNTRGWGYPIAPSRSRQAECRSTSALLSVASEHLSQTALTKIPATRSFSVASAHLQKQWGMAPLAIQKFDAGQSCKLRLSPRTKPMALPAWLKTSFPLHPPSRGGTMNSVKHSARETFPLLPVSNSQERTTGSPARVLQHVGQDRRPGPLAIRRRNPARPFRPGKASSVRLGQRSIVGP